MRKSILAFTQFKSLAEVLKTYRLHFTKMSYKSRFDIEELDILYSVLISLLENYKSV